MGIFFKKGMCENCKNQYPAKKLVNFGGRMFCSEDCLAEYCRESTTAELLRLHEIDQERRHETNQKG